MDVKFDNYQMTDEQKDAIRAKISARLERGFVCKVASRPSYRPTQHDKKMWLSLGDGEFIVASHADDEESVWAYGSTTEQPGNWLCWSIKEVRVGAYLTRDCELRGFDVSIITSPLHDSHARFAPALIMMSARIGLDSENEL